MSTKLTPGQRIVRDLARQIEAKTVRLRNKAALVAGDPTPGRNLTALRTTAREVLDLMREILIPRCNVCGCTNDDCRQCIEKTGCACHWINPNLCSACVEDA